MPRIILLLFVLIFSLSAAAHHSRLEFDDEVLEVEAELVGAVCTKMGRVRGNVNG